MTMFEANSNKHSIKQGARALDEKADGFHRHGNGRFSGDVNRRETDRYISHILLQDRTKGTERKR